MEGNGRDLGFWFSTLINGIDFFVVVILKMRTSHLALSLNLSLSRIENMRQGGETQNI